MPATRATSAQGVSVLSFLGCFEGVVTNNSNKDNLKIAGLFAGIGGIEQGMHQAGHETVLLCELDDAAGHVLTTRFPDPEFVRDVRDVKDLNGADLVAAGFPCQDLSQAGRTAGITGEQSGLVGEVFRLLEGEARSAKWLLLENVPFMLQLERGKAMRFLTRRLAELGFSWAYRVVDTRAFGLPQRRRRVLLLASRTDDPREVLFTEDAGEPVERDADGVACGFYWTEGARGLGLAIDSVPTLKGGSSVGIPSPPAIWMPDGDVVLPDIRDAERLQGFPADWTAPAQPLGRGRNGPRWKLVGNAVSVPVARWLGERLKVPQSYDRTGDVLLQGEHRWPKAAWGNGDEAYQADVSAWPRHDEAQSIADFLQYPTTRLSERATAGFLKRAEKSTLRFPKGFLSDLRIHLERQRAAA